MLLFKLLPSEIFVGFLLFLLYVATTTVAKSATASASGGLSGAIWHKLALRAWKVVARVRGWLLAFSLKPPLLDDPSELLGRSNRDTHVFEILPVYTFYVIVVDMVFLKDFEIFVWHSCLFAKP